MLQSCPTLRPHRWQPTRLLCPWDSLGKNTGVGCHVLLQGIFPTQGSNPMSHVSCIARWILYPRTTWEALAKLTGLRLTRVCSSAAAKLLQSCPTLCDPVDCSPPGSSIHGIFQARALERVPSPSLVCSSSLYFKLVCHGDFPSVQWLRLHTLNAGGLGSILGHETRSHMLQRRSKAAK